MPPSAKQSPGAEPWRIPSTAARLPTEMRTAVAETKPPGRAGRGIDTGVLLGAGTALLGIVLGILREGGSLEQVLQPAAALIVFFGTCGAVMVQFPLQTIRAALGSVRELLRPTGEDTAAHMQELLRYAAKARRRGLVSLDAELDQVADAFSRRCLTLAVDGISTAEIEEVMEQECLRLEDTDEQQARVWEAAGGFAPTMGILGAVLGLIHVMQRLDNLHQVGQGIAVAFVATLYGVGSANLLFLPIAGRLRLRMQARQQARAMTLDAVLLIVAGSNPRTVRERLSAYSGTAVQPAMSELVVG